MLFFLHGTDGDKARGKSHELYESLLKKKPDASFFRMDAEGWDTNIFLEKIESQGLFENKFIVLLDNVFQNDEAADAVLEKLKELKASANIFILLEGKLDKATASKIEKQAEKTQVFDVAEKIAKKDTFAIFSMTDAFGNRDKKELWILFCKAKMANISAEEIHGILFWQLKSILVAAESKSADEAGLKPFVFSKAKSFARNFSLDELKTLSTKMIGVYHDARRGIHDFDNALEKLILAL